MTLSILCKKLLFQIHQKLLYHIHQNPQKNVYVLKNNNEITETKFKAMRLQNAHPAKATGLPKIHIQFDNLPSF